MWSSKGKVAVVGVALTKMVRYIEGPIGPIAVDTCLKAIEDAGLKPSDIDGIAGLPYEGEGAARVDGEAKVTPAYIMQNLSPDSNFRWYATMTVHPSFPISIIAAVNAI